MELEVYVFSISDVDAINGMNSLGDTVQADTAYMFDPDSPDALLVEVELDTATVEPVILCLK